MKKFFVVADIHSYFDQMQKALNLAGFDIKNPEHTLIVCGDIFDRGNQSKEIYDFLKNKMPEDRLILIRGNHEDLFLDLVNKDFPEKNDFQNQTTKTFCHLAGYDDRIMNIESVQLYSRLPINQLSEYIYKSWQDIKKKVKESDVYTWLKSDKWLNYYEYKNFIFVHSFIPTLIRKEFIYLYRMNLINDDDTRYLVYNPKWRKATDIQWQQARWLNPVNAFRSGCFDIDKEDNKILVCGHYNVDYFHSTFENSQIKNYNIYFGDNLIGIDGCTTLTHHVNVLVIDEDGNILNKEKKQ